MTKTPQQERDTAVAEALSIQVQKGNLSSKEAAKVFTDYLNECGRLS